MKVWLPSIRSQSGSDVFVERLSQLLSKAGCEVQTSWFSLGHELLPWGLQSLQVPAGTDLIHANSWNAFAFARPGLPLVVTVHHCVRNTGYPAWKTLAQSLYHDHWIGSLEAKSFKRADAILAGTQSAAREVASEFALGDKLETIEYWIDVLSYRPSEPREIGKRVLWVGNMSLRKGADMLPAFRRCLDPSIELNIVGGRRAEGAGLERLGANVKVWPRLSEAELIRLYQDCDVTVSLSRHEGFGYTALEAMACGRPVVAFDVTGIRDVVQHGTTGLLCHVDDVGAVAGACERLLSEPRTWQQMGASARSRAVEHFAPERAARRYIDVYRRLIESKK